MTPAAAAEILFIFLVLAVVLVVVIAGGAVLYLVFIFWRHRRLRNEFETAFQVIHPPCPVTRAVRPPPRRTIGRGGSGGGSGWAR